MQQDIRRNRTIYVLFIIVHFASQVNRKNRQIGTNESYESLVVYHSSFGYKSCCFENSKLIWTPLITTQCTFLQSHTSFEGNIG